MSLSVTVSSSPSSDLSTCEMCPVCESICHSKRGRPSASFSLEATVTNFLAVSKWTLILPRDCWDGVSVGGFCLGWGGVASSFFFSYPASIYLAFSAICEIVVSLADLSAGGAGGVAVLAVLPPAPALSDPPFEFLAAAASISSRAVDFSPFFQ